MVERGEADDKILAVLLGDPTYGEIVDVSQLPVARAHRRSHRMFCRAKRTCRGQAPIGWS
jgi:inorganic pyrophosphatase